MNRKLLVTALGLFTFALHAQDRSYDLLQSDSKTHILIDRVWCSSKINEQQPSELNAANFRQIYSELQRADFTNRFPDLSVFETQKAIAHTRSEFPLALLVTEFESIPTNQYADLQKNSQGQWVAKGNSNYLQPHTFAGVAPLLLTSRTNEVTFTLPEALIFSGAKHPNVLQLQLENGANYTLAPGQRLPIQFSNAGKHTIQVTTLFSDGSQAQNKFTLTTEGQIYGKQNSFTLQPNVVNTITSTLAYQGYGETAAFQGQGEYELFMDTTNGILDKPIILLDGFDPGDTRNTTIVYNALNYGVGQNMGDDLRALGFDVIVLNFPNYVRPNTTTTVDGGVDFIQRNAYVLVELINQINAQKVGNEQNVVIGPSMGGLISRYALRYMEQNNMSHQTRLYISFDSPHLGANVPIGFQHLFNYMAYGPVGDTTMQTIVNGMLKSPAARQMLIDHLEGHLQAGSAYEFMTATNSLLPTGAPNYRNAFQTELNTMGFPTTVRNVAIANGAGNGTMTGSPDMVVMDHTFNQTSTQRAIINLRFTPAAGQTNQVSRFRAQTYILFGWVTVLESLANCKYPTTTSGLDSAPGGRFDMSGLNTGGTTNALFTEFMNSLQIMYFDFIPTMSSLAISNSTNYYAPVSTASTTPFVNYHVPTTNENHVTLTPDNRLFAYNEIVQGQLGSPSLAIEQLQIKNPVGAQLEIYAPYEIQQAQLTLTDTLGKVIWTTQQPTFTGNLTLPLALESGIYLLTFQNESGKSTYKLIKS
ncbi:MAG: hypothetical protein RL607_3 [Bacteroidota bacterium]|jgi:pimeloyl-ACP methyl ester carboxylesterase